MPKDMTVPLPRPDYVRYKKTELLTECKTLGIKASTSMAKRDLIKLLREYEAQADPDDPVLDAFGLVQAAAPFIPATRGERKDIRDIDDMLQPSVENSAEGDDMIARLDLLVAFLPLLAQLSEMMASIDQLPQLLAFLPVLEEATRSIPILQQLPTLTEEVHARLDDIEGTAVHWEQAAKAFKILGRDLAIVDSSVQQVDRRLSLIEHRHEEREKSLDAFQNAAIDVVEDLHSRVMEQPDYSAEVRSIENAMKAELAEMRRQSDEELAALRQENALALAAMRQGYADELAAMRREMADVVAACRALPSVTFPIAPASLPSPATIATAITDLDAQAPTVESPPKQQSHLIEVQVAAIPLLESTTAPESADVDGDDGEHAVGIHGGDLGNDDNIEDAVVDNLAVDDSTAQTKAVDNCSGVAVGIPTVPVDSAPPKSASCKRPRAESTDSDFSDRRAVKRPRVNDDDLDSDFSKRARFLTSIQPSFTPSSSEPSLIADFTVPASPTATVTVGDDSATTANAF